MTLNSYSKLPDFLATCQNFLDQDEVYNHLMTGIANRLNSTHSIPEGAYLLSIQDENRDVVFACVQSPGREMIINGHQKAIPEFLNFLEENQEGVKGFSAPKALAEQIVQAWETKFNGKKTRNVTQK